ncbi:DUF397 domain-containing protein [Actinosynnema sp. NPDC023587]|uniref:DUF397 domain-containing protein n=1 Tax=Actinosynnema sp. NPDC023587 TaxID=3154695 RepID=UPI00340A8451
MIEDAVLWRKSSRSGGSNGGGGSNCVEVTFVEGSVGFRDSKHPDVDIAFGADAFSTFVAAAKHGGFEQ